MLSVWQRSRSFRDKDGNAVSNAFIADEQVESLLLAQSASVLGRPHSAILIVDREYFEELYFSATSNLELEEAISKVEAIKSLVVELVHKPPINQELISAFISNDFQVRRELIRLSKRGQEKLSYDESGQSSPKIKITSACMQDAQIVQDILLDEFDKFSERVPSISEVEVSIANEEIFISSENGRNCGIIWFTDSGNYAHLRYIAVLPEFRGAGVGSCLMNFMLSRLEEAGRIDLWVVSDNQRAINMYSKLGFVRDGLANVVLMKEKNESSNNSGSS